MKTPDQNGQLYIWQIYNCRKQKKKEKKRKGIKKKELAPSPTTVFCRQGKMANIKFGKSGPFFLIFCVYLKRCMWPSLFMICRILSGEDTSIMGSPHIRAQDIDSFEILFFLFVTHLLIITYLVIAIYKYTCWGDNYKWGSFGSI